MQGIANKLELTDGMSMYSVPWVGAKKFEDEISKSLWVKLATDFKQILDPLLGTFIVILSS